MRFIKPITIVLIACFGAGCSQVDALRSGTIFSKRNADGVACIYRPLPDDRNSAGIYTKSFEQKWSWECPLTFKESTEKQQALVKQEVQRLTLPMDNADLKALIEDPEFQKFKKLEPLKSFIVKAKEDGKITNAEYIAIQRMIKDLRPKELSPEDKAAAERGKLLSQL